MELVFVQSPVKKEDFHFLSLRKILEEMGRVVIPQALRKMAPFSSGQRKESIYLAEPSRSRAAPQAVCESVSTEPSSRGAGHVHGASGLPTAAHWSVLKVSLGFSSSMKNNRLNLKKYIANNQTHTHISNMVLEPTYKLLYLTSGTNHLCSYDLQTLTTVV